MIAVSDSAIETVAGELARNPGRIRVAKVTGDVRIAAAAWLGSTRLIDNVLCAAEAPAARS